MWRLGIIIIIESTYVGKLNLKRKWNDQNKTTSNENIHMHENIYNFFLFSKNKYK